MHAAGCVDSLLRSSPSPFQPPELFPLALLPPAAPCAQATFLDAYLGSMLTSGLAGDTTVSESTRVIVIAETVRDSPQAKRPTTRKCSSTRKGNLSQTPHPPSGFSPPLCFLEPTPSPPPSPFRQVATVRTGCLNPPPTPAAPPRPFRQLHPPRHPSIRSPHHSVPLIGRWPSCSSLF